MAKIRWNKKIGIRKAIDNQVNLIAYGVQPKKKGIYLSDFAN